MYWTLELASKLEDAPWPASKDELIDYAIRSGAPMEVIENLQDIEDDEEIFESIEDIWPDYPSKDDFFFNEDEYWFIRVNEKITNHPLRSGSLFYIATWNLPHCLGVNIYFSSYMGIVIFIYKFDICIRKLLKSIEAFGGFEQIQFWGWV